MEPNSKKKQVNKEDLNQTNEAKLCIEAKPRYSWYWYKNDV